ncbi:MAG: helix-turn-helix domain-containing protein, partial [Phycisphaerae bacterium]
QRALLLQEGPVIEAGDLTLMQGELQPSVTPLDEMRFDLSSGDCTLAQVEERLIRQALAACDGNISETARLLGVSRGALRHRLERLSLPTQIRQA